MKGVLSQEGDCDYTLKKGERSCWITVDNLSIYIIRTDEGILVEIYRKGHEAEDAIGVIWA